MEQKRHFSAEFKTEAVALVLEQSYTLSRAAQALDINPKTLSSWVQNARQQPVNNQLNQTEREELYQLRRENKELRIEKEILKKASAFFAKEMK